MKSLKYLRGGQIPTYRIKEQLDQIRQEMIDWPDWRKREIETEVLKTPECLTSGTKDLSTQKMLFTSGVRRNGETLLS